MRVARLYSFGDIRVEDAPVPMVSDGEALIKVHASGICSGDVMPWYIEKKAPLVIGHEPAGEIIETVGGVKGFTRGDRVFVHHHAPCLTCISCLRGDYVQCDTWRNSRIIPGGISEYILIPGINLLHDTLKLPGEISYEDATLIEPLACVVKSMRRSGLKRGDTVAVIGLGVMGILHLILARHYGAGRVVGADREPFRLKKALKMGADSVVDTNETSLHDGVYRLTDGRGAEVVIAGPNSVEAMREGLDIAAPGGTLLLFTPARPGEVLDIDPNTIYFKDISIVTSYSCGPDDTRLALSLIREGVINAGDIITHRFPIEKTSEAYETVSRAGESLKVIVVF